MPQCLSREFWGIQEHVSQHAAGSIAVEGSVGCRQGLQQWLGHPSHGLSPAAGWLGGNWAAASADGWSRALQGCRPKSLSTSRGICHQGTVPLPCLWLDTRSHPEKPPLCLQGERDMEQGTAPGGAQRPLLPALSSVLRSLGWPWLHGAGRSPEMPTRQNSLSPPALRHSDTPGTCSYLSPGAALR